MSDLLSLVDLSVKRAGRTLLSKLSCSFKAGEVVVLGPNGAGKSNLLLALAGLIPCHGEAKQIFTSERLTKLYHAPVINQGNVLVPNYGEYEL